MHDRALAYVHALALRSRRFEKRLVANPRAVLQKERVSEAEIRLIEALAPQNAYAFGLAIWEVDRLLHSVPDDGYMTN